MCEREVSFLTIQWSVTIGHHSQYIILNIVELFLEPINFLNKI